MTQLIIAGVEAVLPQNFSVTVKRENPFFTKSGQYTYDCTLRLDNPVNQQLYGFLHRVNRSGQIETDRTAILMADGHVYCRGTEVITRWTDQTVTIQILSGESELNFFIGQDKKVEDLDLGDIGCRLSDLEGHVDAYRYDLLANQGRTYPESDFCLPTIRTENGVFNLVKVFSDSDGIASSPDSWYNFLNALPQPYLCAIIDRLLKALGYNQDAEGNPIAFTNQLKDTQFKNLFLVNTVRTTEYAKMLPGWTVKDFLSEVEKLTGVVFITDNIHKRCDILLKTVFYNEARQLPLSDVVDAYEAEVQTEEGREAEFTASDVSYELPDHHIAKLMKLPEDFLAARAIYEHPSIAEMAESAPERPSVVHRNTSTGRLYIVAQREWQQTGDADITAEQPCLIEVDQFCNLDREDNTSTLELKITPAPMGVVDKCKGEAIDLVGTKESSASTTEGEEGQEEDMSLEEIIQDYEKTESQAGDIYCAFFNGFYIDHFNPLAYTDDSHAAIQNLLYPFFNAPTSDIMPYGSLRLSDLDADYYQGGYEIDTRHAMTFETFDPNTIDVRQVYVIRNRRFVVRDVEETITAEGRKPLWRVTCFPIKVSDEAIEKRWVLTHGVWDDGAAWLDDGRWNDTDPNSQ